MGGLGGKRPRQSFPVACLPARRAGPCHQARASRRHKDRLPARKGCRGRFQAPALPMNLLLDENISPALATPLEPERRSDPGGRPHRTPRGRRSHGSGLRFLPGSGGRHAQRGRFSESGGGSRTAPRPHRPARRGPEPVRTQGRHVHQVSFDPADEGRTRSSRVAGLARLPGFCARRCYWPACQIAEWKEGFPGLVGAAQPRAKPNREEKSSLPWTS